MFIDCQDLVNLVLDTPGHTHVSDILSVWSSVMKKSIERLKNKNYRMRTVPQED